MIYYLLYELLYNHFKDKEWYLVKALNVFQYVTFRTAYASITGLLIPLVFGGRAIQMLREWNMFRKRNPRARLVCIDVQPYGTTQAAERDDVLNIGGFSDRIFEVVSDFAAGRLDADHWVGVIESMEI